MTKKELQKQIDELNFKLEKLEKYLGLVYVTVLEEKKYIKPKKDDKIVSNGYENWLY